MKTIIIQERAGVFAENKDVAGDIREQDILPALRANQQVTLDFAGVDGATQSFVHAMISEAIRELGPDVLDHIVFKNCNQSVRSIIEIVVDYMQESV